MLKRILGAKGPSRVSVGGGSGPVLHRYRADNAGLASLRRRRDIEALAARAENFGWSKAGRRRER